MTPERWQKVGELYHATLERAPEERAEFLQRFCDGDADLRREVEELLAADDNAGSFMSGDVMEDAARMLANEQSGALVGQTVGHYQVIELLGQGGMGDVYLAEDTRLKRRVALKLLPAYFLVSRDRVNRFEQEARAISALNHPNIVTIHESGRFNGSNFIVTEFVDGQTLRELMSERRPAVIEALDITVQVASALEAAHAAGVIHRDIKPENVMLRHDGYVKVLDFGLAKLAERQTATKLAEAPTRIFAGTQPGIVMGSTSYISPEQARGVDIDERTDIWSLGIVLYEMLAGRVPFSGETPSHVMVSLMENELPPLADRAEVPDELERIVTRALQKNKRDRYQNVRDLAHDLKNLKQKLQVEAHLKDALEAVPSHKKIATKSDQPRADTAAPAAAAHTQDIGVTHPTSSAEYWVREMKQNRLAVLLVAASLAVAAIVIGYFYFAGKNKLAPSISVKSIAVLPLKSINNDPNDDYLGFGIADTIITRLSQLREVTVRPTSAVFKYTDRNTDAVSAGRQLQADAVLDGTVQRVGARVRLNLNLIKVQDGQSLWSESFDLSSTDIFSAQDQVSERVTQRLRLKLAPQEAKSRTVNSEAYDEYLRGKFYLYRWSRADNDRAIELLEQAVRKDQNFAPAYASLAQAYRLKFYFFTSQQQPWEEKALIAADKAISLDPDLADAYLARGVLLWTQLRGFPHERATREFRRALDLNPNLDEAHRQLGTVYNHIGLLDKAYVEAQRAAQINPSYVGPPLGGALLFNGKYDEAYAHLNASKDLNSQLWVHQMALTLHHLGRKDESSALVEDYLQKHPEDPGAMLTSMRALLFASSGDKYRAEENIQKALQNGQDFGHFHHATYHIAAAYAIMKKRDKALRWLKFTADNGFPCYVLFGHDPDLDNLRQDPSFLTFMSKQKEQWEYFNSIL